MQLAHQQPTPTTETALRDQAPVEHPETLKRADLVRIAAVAVAVAWAWFHPWSPLGRLDLIGVIAALGGGYPIFREAVEALVARRMTMELSMPIAIVAALAIGEVFTALVIVLFVLIAEVLEHLTVARGRGAIRDLLDFLPRDATIRRGDATEAVGIHAVRVDDVVIVKPGSRLPVDGVVTAGQSFVDEATITGESLPVEKGPGSGVYAGTINQSGMLEVRVARVGRETAFGKIVDAVERAEASRAPIQKIADRLAGYLVYFALGTAGLTFLLTRDARSTIAVVIVAGACGIAAGTPLAILGAIGQAARRGVIVKGGLPLEVLAHVNAAVFDKTGTLTYGTPVVAATEPAVGVSAEELLTVAATAEARSEHPFAKAILAMAAERSLRVAAPEAFAYTPGKGILCRANGDEIAVGNRDLLHERGVSVPETSTNGHEGSRVFVARGMRFLGTLRVTDRTREDARTAIQALRALGIRTTLLTGDSAPVATAVGRDLGVDKIASELLPDEKLARIEALKISGQIVMMVGDGVNDAPALMEASVGVAMGSGTDVARESASVMLLGNDLTALVDTVKLARRCYRIIMANFVGTLAVDGLGVGLAAFGFLNPLVAAFIHVSSELVFILNSARLLRHAKHEHPA
jgi:Cd2+/Zn2+-exporting ATPase/Cu+-exporting ATPase